jgi:hypothetical protein
MYRSHLHRNYGIFKRNNRLGGVIPVDRDLGDIVFPPHHTEILRILMTECSEVYNEREIRRIKQHR